MRGVRVHVLLVRAVPVEGVLALEDIPRVARQEEHGGKRRRLVERQIVEPIESYGLDYPGPGALALVQQHGNIRRAEFAE